MKADIKTTLPMTGGLDEASPVNAVAPEDAIVMENWRLSRDGKRIEKRLGLTQEVTDFGVDVYGYTSYKNDANVYCEAAVLETGISRKVTGGNWGSIHTWSPVTLTGSIDPAASTSVVGVGTKFLTELRVGNSIIVSGETRTVATITDDTHLTVTAAFSNNANDTTPDKSFTLAHPVTPIEAQGKIFVIHEDAGRMIHYDGNDYQIGITPPTTVPAAATTYPPEDTLPVNDLFAYANTAAMDAVWTDGDVGNGQSTIATSGPATQGPDAHDLYLKLTASATASTTIAKRSMTVSTSFGSKFTLELNSYFDFLGSTLSNGGFFINIYTGAFRLPLSFGKGNLSIVDSKGNRYSFSSLVSLDAWANWKFIVDGTNSTAITVSAYKDGAFLKTITYSYLDTTNEDLIEIIQNNKGGSTVKVTYVDNLKITTDSSTVASSASSTGVPGQGTGAYRYAITYFRAGNYGCESNPLKSVVGSATFTGTGLNDLTVSGTYTGALTKTFRVEIDGTGTPNTIKWSEDAGVTWNSKLINVTTTMYLSYGIVLTFGATTGHTSGDYWAFTCTLLAASPVGQVVNLTSIPVSSDSQVTGRKIYRTTLGGTRFYWLATIYDNTSTTYTDNVSDTALALGAEVEEDHDIAPNGKFSAWWDNRLWIAQDDIVYYSQDGIPEHFSLSARNIPIEKGDPNDKITQLVAFKDSLYVFRKKSIYSIQANAVAYGKYLIENHTGCRAPWSMVEVNNNLVFLSDRGLEVFNGVDCYPVSLSDKIIRSIGKISPAYYDYISAVLVRDRYEIWISIPDPTSGSAFTIVYNYIYDKFHIFSFYKTPSCLVTAEDSTSDLVTKMGTRDGYLCLCDTTYRDHATNITATYRKGWMRGEAYENVRRVDVIYELPTSMTLTANIYVNFDKDVQRTAALTGSTPSATDIELRRPIKAFAELGQRAEWWTVELTNAEKLGGDLKVSEIALWHETPTVKGKVYGD